MDVKFMWGNSNYNYVFSEAVGNSGGILCVWEATVFKKDYATISDNFVAIYGTWLPTNSKVLFVAIYAPQQVPCKRFLWDYVSTLIDRWNGEVVVLGDFNEVRNIDERRGSCFNPTSAKVFDQFISASGLVDVKMEGYAFTWSHPSGSKMSKLDRFLVSEGIFSIFLSITAVCIDYHLSDHRPVILSEVQADFGPIPFLFYHSCLSLEGFDAMVEQTWRSFSHNDANRMIRFKKKLQDLKVRIRGWVKDKRLSVSGEKDSIKKELSDIDSLLDCGAVSDSNLLRRSELHRNLYNINQMESKEYLQKSKIKWVIEGDENSKFFHGLVNKKRSQLAIRGVFVDGIWCTNPNKVKEVFFKHFEARFKKPVKHRLMINLPFNKRLSDVQAGDLERSVSRDEISIALIPKVTYAKFVNDFRPISLIGSVYKVVTKVLANRLALVISDLISDSQSAFVANRQILDGPFILNELLHWCKRKKKQAMFFKVDFAKAYDSVRWDYLLDVLEAFGFGNIWCKWIRGTFSSAKASVLVNGSPTIEFPFHCGLKQGDPLSPYLFILIMESLNMSFTRAIDEGVFKGVHLHGSTSISHLFYADDAMFIGEWSDANLKGIINILQCFFLASGLKINIHKSQVLGVGVPSSIVMQAASSIGCGVLHKKFRYLGVMVGECMSRHKAWDSTVDKLRSRLSKWKVKTLSIGGRLTLLKAVLGASPLYNMSIFKVPKGILNSMEALRSKFFNGMDPSTKKITWAAWNKVLASKNNGGLGVSSFHALNRALLLKWVWRFISQDGSLWFRVIKALYGSSIDSHPVNLSSNWCSIIRELHFLAGKGFLFVTHCKKRIGNGRGSQFWFDTWLGDMPLKDLFPRLFALDLDSEATVAAKMQDAVSFSFRRPVRDGVESQQLVDITALLASVSLSSSADRWVCDLSGDGEFRVKDVRNLLDNMFLPSFPDATRWIKCIPIKINVFVWRARRDFLPTRVNLSRRGIIVDSISCPLCSSSEEDIHHLLFGCDMAKNIFRRLCHWWELDWQALGSFLEWYTWFSSIRLSSKVKALLEGVFYIAWWSIWRFRNRYIFDASPPRRSMLFDDIMSLSFNWCSSRCNMTFSWDSWLKNPHLISL
ncbi:RNA-directed DNA polymerase, eukaryota [Tanacetum coccineum]